MWVCVDLGVCVVCMCLCLCDVCVCLYGVYVCVYVFVCVSVCIFPEGGAAFRLILRGEHQE